tara:strand:- start:2681 stop:2815 length:135 start_codon:yes stop_codon:yes gene_type:complete
MINIIKRALRVTKNKKDRKTIIKYIDKLKDLNIINDNEYKYLLK